MFIQLVIYCRKWFWFGIFEYLELFLFGIFEYWEFFEEILFMYTQTTKYTLVPGFTSCTKEKKKILFEIVISSAQ